MEILIFFHDSPIRQMSRGVSMSILGRFRKPGGFQQLLALLETCEPAKQKNLLHLIGTEDPGWAYMVKMKVLTFERILSWPVEIIAEITPALPDLILATAYQMAGTLKSKDGSNLQEKWIQSVPRIKAKEIQYLADFQTFSAAELTAAIVKVLQTAREAESLGRIRFANFDPQLEIDKQIAA
jgi:hypothetical protein